MVIAGPTAVGKTSCAIEVAKHFNTEIINADSRQIYEGLEIGTAKPTLEELNDVKHHFVNHLELDESYTAGKYEKDVDLLLVDLFKKKDVVVLSGGTGFYINAVVNGLDDMPNSDPSIRKQLNEEFEANGLERLLVELQLKDEATFLSVDHANPHRIMRALEVIRFTGKPYSSFKERSSKKHNFSMVKIALNLPREELYKRINLRVDKMIDEGLVDEVIKYKSFKDQQALRTVGYKEIFQYLDKEILLEEAIELIKRNSRRYAKRQITWLKRDEEYHWFHPKDVDEMIKHIEE